MRQWKGAHEWEEINRLSTCVAAQNELNGKVPVSNQIIWYEHLCGKSELRNKHLGLPDWTTI